MVMVLGSLRPVNSSPIHTTTNASSSNSSEKKSQYLTRRRTMVFGPSVLVASLLNFNPLSSSSPPSFHLALAQQQQLDELQQAEDRAVQLFQEASPSVVLIKDFEIDKIPKTSSADANLIEDENAKVEGTGSGFISDKFGHIVYLADANGNGFYREGKIVGVDPAYDLPILKVDAEGYELKPVVVGTSQNLLVGQSCFAIGNPCGYENTLTTGVVSGLRREIPSPKGSAIRGAIQTDADINAGISIALIFIIVGIGFKLSPVPFHQWTPNVYEGVRFVR